VFVRQQGTDWEDPRFHVTFERVAEPTSRTEPATPTAARTTAPRLRLTVVKGSTDQKAYAFAGGRIDIGRRSEVIDQRQRLVRTNQIAFVDDDTPDNRSVSRRHAHIEYVESEGTYRIWDDRSAHGTTIVRGGKTIKVAAGARGMRLVGGDEIAVGHARLKVTIG
jgi:predicted component of type VI protein secretion system